MIGLELALHRDLRSSVMLSELISEATCDERDRIEPYHDHLLMADFGAVR